MPSTTATLLAISADLHAAADALAVAGERVRALEGLLHRCRVMCREDGLTLGPIAEALANEIDLLMNGEK